MSVLLRPIWVQGRGLGASRPDGRVIQSVVFASLWLLALMPARASSACEVLLCLAAPSWRDFHQCVAPVRQVLRDIARGKPFPICTMSGAGNTAANEWAYAPGFCPPQYSRVHQSESGPIHVCDYTGAISVWVNGVLFTRTWWSMDGDAVTDFSPAARAQLGTWNTRFDDEYAAWLAALPPPAAPIDSGH